MQEIAPNVAGLPLSIENIYFVGAPRRPWVLVDAGTPGMAGRIRRRRGRGTARMPGLRRFC